ncbi:MAG TPA: PEP-CTERM sorting domain-containing protein [Burkholderiales bacterium]|nr:PEP-CTERM sorting domain-containing protein [Burkholderiales bacterium]
MNASRGFKCLGVFVALGFTTFLSMSAFSVKSDLPSDPHKANTVAASPTRIVIAATATGNDVGSTITLQNLSSGAGEEESSGESESVATHSSIDGDGIVVAGSRGQSDRRHNAHRPHATGAGGAARNSGGGMPQENPASAGGNSSFGPNSNSPSDPNSNSLSGAPGGVSRGPSGPTIGGGGGAPLADGPKGIVSPEESPAEDSKKQDAGPAIEDLKPELGVPDINNPSLIDPIVDFDEGVMPLDLSEQLVAIEPTSDDKREASVVPEPATIALLGFGLLSLVVMGRRRNR